MKLYYVPIYVCSANVLYSHAIKYCASKGHAGPLCAYSRSLVPRLGSRNPEGIDNRNNLQRKLGIAN